MYISYRHSLPAPPPSHWNKLPPSLPPLLILLLVSGLWACSQLACVCFLNEYLMKLAQRTVGGALCMRAPACLRAPVCVSVCVCGGQCKSSGSHSAPCIIHVEALHAGLPPRGRVLVCPTNFMCLCDITCVSAVVRF